MIFVFGYFIQLGCQSKEYDTALDCDNAPLYQDWLKGFLQGKCQACHASTSPNRYGAPEDIYFDTEDAAIFYLEQIEDSVLLSERMPPSGGVSEEEKQLLQHWIDCNQ